MLYINLMPDMPMCYWWQ